MSTIPASQLVNVTPSVISAGGNALNLIGLILDSGPRVPIGSVLSFSSQSAVAAYFGASSNHAATAGIYFGGFIGSTALPGSVLFAQYNLAPVSAYVRGGSIGTTSLATIQSINANLTVTIDGSQKSATINLATATSFSNAAELIGFDLGIEGVQDGVMTGAIAGTTLTVSSVSSGQIGPGDVISGSGVTANTFILAQLTGTTGGVGTYTVSASQSVASTTITAFKPGVIFDSVANAFQINSGTTGTSSTMTFASGAAATSLFLTSATGAVLSQGAAAATPATFMNGILGVTTNWATFMTMFDPDQGSGNTQKQAFSQWKDGQNNRYAYICWDPDPNPLTTLPATGSLGALLPGINDSGTCLISEPAEILSASGFGLAAFVCGAVASINFTQPGGRATLAYKAQSGLLADVTNGQTATNLLGNGYNFYGAYGSGSQTFVNFQNGSCTGPFKWLDSYVNQIWLNASFQSALLTFLTNVLSVPYTDAGNAMIANALQPVITAGLSFGAYQPGTISAAEASAIATATGSQQAPNTLQAQGWYLQILPATAAQRAARGSPPAVFYYLDRGSVQQINLASIEVQ